MLTILMFDQQAHAGASLHLANSLPPTALPLLSALPPALLHGVASHATHLATEVHLAAFASTPTPSQPTPTALPTAPT